MSCLLRMTAMGEDWTKRRAVPQDEPCLVSMWLKSYAHSREVREMFPGAREPGNADQFDYWRTYQPIVTSLVRSADVEVLCDPDRATYECGPAVILAWACTSGPLVYWVSVKHRVRRIDIDLARDMAGDLVGHLVERSARSMFDLVDMAGLGVPSPWRRDRHWLRSLVELHRQMLEGDRITEAVGRHLFDTARAVWTPNGEAA